MRKSSLYFYLLALTWLPLLIIVLTLLRGFALPEQGWQDWLFFSILFPSGLFLPLPCRAIWRMGYRKTVYVLLAVFGPLTVLYGIVGGLLGPFGIMGSVAFCSVPAMLTWGVLWLINKKRAAK